MPAYGHVCVRVCVCLWAADEEVWNRRPFSQQNFELLMFSLPHQSLILKPHFPERESKKSSFPWSEIMEPQTNSDRKRNKSFLVYHFTSVIVLLLTHPAGRNETFSLIVWRFKKHSHSLFLLRINRWCWYHSHLIKLNKHLTPIKPQLYIFTSAVKWLIQTF